MAALDHVVNAALEGVKKSGLVESGALLATVTSVPGGGVVSVSRAGDVYPKVRLLSGYSAANGDLVLILRTNGGWVCLGKLAS